MNLFTDVNEFIKWVEIRSRFSKKVSLDNMRYFASLFGNPQNKFNSIHVTGTNGKGSTVSYLKNIYLKQNLNVATFTSPYIICFNERITYNNKFISDEDLLKRKYFAELMAKALVNLQNSDTFTIGLYGRWGNGKTSLVNMMLKEIEMPPVHLV